MSKHLRQIVCLECGKALPNLDVLVSNCPHCGSGWLDAHYDYDAVRVLWSDQLSSREQTLWRYAELFPVNGVDPEISLQEGYTPLLRLYQYERLYNHAHIYVKDERQGPTSSFKDRQAALSVTALKEAGITECVLASAGNAGVAYAAYCARAGIKLWLFVSSLVPSEKMREAMLYGAEVVKVTGTYDEAKRVAAEFAERKGIFHDKGARTIPSKESMKTLAFEIAEQLGLQLEGKTGVWRTPDWYVQAVSGGLGPLGLWKGFTELYKMGFITKLPKLAIVQAAGCAPMVEAFHQNLSHAEPVIPKTLITVLSTGNPGHSYVLLREAVLSTGGTMLAVEDGEAFEAMRHVARRGGLSVEPAAAVAFAGLEKMLQDGTIGADESVVVNCSGHTFPVESYVLSDLHVLSLDIHAESPALKNAAMQEEGLGTALQNLDERVTSILIVDDNPSDRRLIRRLLQRYKQYRIYEASSGAEAIQMAIDYKPDLIVSDLTMPEMDGFALMERIKTHPDTATIPIVVVSAKTISEHDQQLLEQYSESVWLKGDFNTTQLVDHVVNVLGDQPIDIIKPSNPSPTIRADVPTNADEPANVHTVVVIDDNARDRRLTRRLLEASHRYQVIEAETGRQGLKLVYEHHPDLIILDLMLPDLDGFVILEKLQNDKRLSQIPVIVLSAKELTPEERTQLQESIRSLIQKSQMDKNQLLKTVDEAVIK